MLRSAVCLPVVLFAGSVLCAAEKPTADELAFFETKIRPVLVKHCYACHSQTAKKVKGGLLLDTREGIRKGGETGHAVTPRDLEDSLLIAAIKHTGDVTEMPPDGKLPDSVIADFEKWIRMGAPDPRDGALKVRKTKITKAEIDKARKENWAFQPPKAPTAPQIKDAAWAKSVVDQFVLARLEANGIKPAGEADRRTWIRRATFDLTGLPPTPAEVDAFLKDNSAKAYETVIDRLLASPRFGERWGRHWLDVARYAESTGKERNYVYPQAWRYRNYVIDAVNADKPYDEFIREQLAGDLLPAKNDAERNEHLIATGFLAIGPKGLNERNRLKFTMDVVDDQIDATTRAVMGMTVACARCHDHKFDPIPTSDYYALAGIFRSTDVRAGLRGARGNRQSGGINSVIPLAGKQAVAKKTEPAKPKVNPRQRQIDKLEKQIAEARDIIRKAGANKKAKKKAKKQANTPEVRQARQTLKRLNKQLARLRGGNGRNAQAAPAGPGAMGVLEARSVIDSKVFARGDVDNQEQVVPRGFVSVAYHGDPVKLPSNQSGRLQLANWLTQPDHPLTARVAVNRIWQHLFGKGIVATSDNFGKLGEEPTHPQLLDHLAIEFVKDGWSVKRAIKRIMLSRAYRMSSDHNALAYKADPDNRLLWRMPRRRLDAESIRDAVLSISGRLDLTRPETSLVASLGAGEIGRNNRGGSATVGNIRSVYLPVVRQRMPAMLQAFDVADPSLIVGRRDVTTVATQALFMMNSPFVISQSERVAEKLLERKDMSDAARIDAAYQLILSRPVEDAERKQAQAFIDEFRKEKPGSTADKEALAAFCQTLFASAEFRYVY